MKDFILISAILLVQVAHADILVPATSDDQQQFEEQLKPKETSAAVPSGKKDKKRKKPNFGAIVSDHAKELKSSGEPRQGMGDWVSDQRQNSSDEGLKGNSEDAHSSAPTQNNTGPNPNAPGQSRNHKK